MATTPIIQSNGSSSGLGTAGEGRNDLVSGETVSLSDTEPTNSGESYTWSFEDIPIGSTTILINPTTATPSFVPDISGSYRIKCTVNGTFSAVEVLAVPLDNTGARIPSFQEELQYDAASNALGWHEAQTVFMRQVDVLLGPSGSNTLGEAYNEGGAGAGRTITADSGAVVIESTAADTNNILEVTKNPGSAQAGEGISLTMGANATGDAISITNSGSGAAMTFDNGQILGGAGSANFPTYSFTGFPDEGLYRGTFPTLAHGGQGIINWSTGRIQFNKAAQFIDGTVTAPSLRASNDNDTGLFWPATGEIAITASEVEVARFTSTPQLLVPDGDGSVPAIAPSRDPADGIYFNTNAIRFAIGSNGRFFVTSSLVSSDESVRVTQQPTSGTTVPHEVFELIGGAHTNITASTEAIDVDFNLRRTVEFATGDLSVQRAVRIQSPSYAFVGASTIDRAALLELEAAPLASTNATIVESWSLSAFGPIHVDRNSGLGVSTDHGLVVRGSASGLGDGFVSSPVIALVGRSILDGIGEQEIAHNIQKGFGIQTVPGTTSTLSFYYQDSVSFEPITESGWGTAVLELTENGELLAGDGTGQSPIYGFNGFQSGVGVSATGVLLLVAGNGANRVQIQNNTFAISYAAADDPTTPRIALAADINTGFTWVAADHIATTTGGSYAQQWNSSQQSLFADGLEASPSISFISDPNTGFFSTFSDQVGFVSGGTEAFFFTGTAIGGVSTGSGRITSGGGTVSFPAFQFRDDSDTGMYRPAANECAITTGATEAVRWNSSQQTLFTDGTFLLPSLAFASDVDTGMYLVSDGTPGITCAGTQRMRVSGSAMVLTTNLTVNQPADSAGLNASLATFTGGALNNMNEVETPDVVFDLSHTIDFTISTGTLTSQRSFQVLAPSYTANIASLTITNAATCYIDAAPTASTNVIITNAYALWVDAGVSRFDGSIQAADGTAAAPSIAFTNEPDCGFYVSGTNQIGVTTNGAQRFNITGTALSGVSTGAARITSGGGAVSLPTYHFTGDSDSGMFRAAADIVAIGTGGTEAIRWNASQQTLVIDGTAGAPSISFASDTNTGLFLQSGDHLGVAAAGNTIVVFDNPDSVDGDTGLTIAVGTASSHEDLRVDVGADDSGGTGFRVLRVPN